MPAKHYITLASASICYWLHKWNNASVQMYTHTRICARMHTHTQMWTYAGTHKLQHIPNTKLNEPLWTLHQTQNHTMDRFFVGFEHFKNKISW